MRFYRIALRDQASGSHGYEFATSEAEAKKISADWKQEQEGREAPYEPIEVTPTKDGIRRALSKYAGHPDNG